MGPDRGPGGDIVLVGAINARPGLGLDPYLVPRGDQLGHRGRGQADAVFMVLDFPGNADAHEEVSPFLNARFLPIFAGDFDCRIMG